MLRCMNRMGTAAPLVLEVMSPADVVKRVITILDVQLLEGDIVFLA